MQTHTQQARTHTHTHTATEANAQTSAYSGHKERGSYLFFHTAFPYMLIAILLLCKNSRWRDEVMSCPGCGEKDTGLVGKWGCQWKVVVPGGDFVSERILRNCTHTIDFPLLTVLALIWATCLMFTTLRRIIDISANTAWLPCERLHLMAPLKKSCIGTGS